MPRTPLGTMASKYGHGSGDISSFYRAAQRVSCPNRPFGRWADVGQRKNGRSGENFLSETGCAWAIPGGIPSGWGQFGAVKKLLSFIGGLRRQLNALYSRRERPEPCALDPRQQHSYKKSCFYSPTPRPSVVRFPPTATTNRLQGSLGVGFQRLAGWGVSRSLYGGH